MSSEPIRDESAPLVAGMPSDITAAYRRRGRQLWSYGRRMGLDPDAAEDAMQEAFARAADRAPDCIENLDAWLFRVVRNLAVDAHRQAARGRDAWEPDIVATDSGIEDRLVLWQSVDRLPDRQRAVIYLRYRVDLPYGAIASILGIGEGGARASAARALEQLRQRMDRR